MSCSYFLMQNLWNAKSNKPLSRTNLSNYHILISKSLYSRSTILTWSSHNPKIWLYQDFLSIAIPNNNHGKCQNEISNLHIIVMKKLTTYGGFTESKEKTLVSILSNSYPFFKHKICLKIDLNLPLILFSWSILYFE